MRMRILFGFVAVAVMSVGVALAVSNNFVAPKHTVKEVMKLAHDKANGLLGKIQSGKATEEEKKQLLDLYIDLVEGEPKKGDPGEWKMAAGTVMMSAAKVVVGREGAVEELAKTSDCKACHSKFK